MEKENKKRRSLKERIYLLHHYYMRTGFYPFFFKSLLRFFIILSIIVLLVLLVRYEIIQFDVESLIKGWNPLAVLLFFTVSESALGLIPPDFFIVWTKNFDSPYLMLTLLATLSYMGGITSYIWGKALSRIPRIKKFMEERFYKHFKQIRRWGGVLIIISALLPLPFSTLTAVAGMMKYPFKHLLLFGLARFLRFYIYAIPLYHIV